MIKIKDGTITANCKNTDELFGEFLLIVDGVRDAALEIGMPEEEVKSTMDMAYKLGMMSPEEVEAVVSKKLKEVKEEADELQKIIDELLGGKE